MAEIATDTGFLARARENAARESEPLRVLSRVDASGKVLAVCERSGGVLVLARESERGLYAGGASAPTESGEKRDRENGTERYFKQTAALADFADAVEAGLL